MNLSLHGIFFRSNRWLEEQQANILSAAAIITIATVFSGIAGLIRNRILVSYFFKTPQLQTDFEAYWVSFRLPELVFQLLVIGALSAAFIPIFTKYQKISKEAAYQMSSSVLNLILLTFLGFSLVIFIFADPLTKLITGPAFSKEQIALSAHMTRIMLLAQFFFAISNFLSGMIQSYRKFLIPALSPIAYNLGIILGTITLTPFIGIYGPVVGVVLGAFLHSILQLPLAIKLGFVYRFNFSLKTPGTMEVIRLMGPRTLSILINQIQLFATVFFATHLAANTLTIITLAQQLMTLPIRFFGAPISQAAFPFLVKESNDGDDKKLVALIIQSLNQISFFALPASALLLILRIPIVRLAYGAKEFPWPATLMTGRVVAILSLSIAAQALTQTLIRAFYATHDTKRPMIVALLSNILFFNISFISVFVSDFGILGLASALAVSNLFETLLLLLILNRKFKFLHKQEFWVPQLKMISAAFLMAVFLYLPFRTLDKLVFDTTRTVELIALSTVVSTIGMLTYIVVALLLNIRELTILSKVYTALENWKRTLAKAPEAVDTAGQSDESLT